MDHLATDDERRARWYSTQWPRYVQVRPATQISELRRTVPCHEERNESADRSNHPHEEESLFVYSMDWTMATSSSPINDNHHEKESTNVIRETIQQHGFAIVSNVLTKHDCEHALELARDWWEAACFADHHTMQTHNRTNKTVEASSPLNQLSRENEEVCEEDAVARKVPQHSLEGGMLPFYGSGHSTFAWYVRSRPRLLRVFQALHNIHPSNNNKEKDIDEHGFEKEDSKLLSSLDGIVLWSRHHQAPTDAGWFHVDQNPITKPHFCSIQGLVNLLPTNPETGGNALVVGSHQYFPHHYCSSNGTTTENDAVPDNRQNQQKRKNMTKGEANDSQQPRVGESAPLFYQKRLEELQGDDWMEIDPLDTTVLQPDKIVTLLLNAGDLLLWDSRTVHCSYPSIKFRSDHKHQEQPNHQPQSHADKSSEVARHDGFVRAATTVTMIPAPGNPTTISLQVLKARKASCSLPSLRTLTHWIDHVQPLGEERPKMANLEQERIQAMLQWEQEPRPSCDEDSSTRHKKKKVLLDFGELSLLQKRLVVGDSPPLLEG